MSDDVGGDGNETETILTGGQIRAALLKALPFLTHEEKERTVAALVEVGGAFEEVPLGERLGMNYSVSCPDICIVAERAAQGRDLRVLARRVRAPRE